MAESFAQKLAEERRGSVLQTLAEAPAYSANERLLHDVLEDAGLRCTRDQVRTDLAWLRDQGLIEVREIAGLMIATITQSGLDASRGSARIPGVARPQAPR